MKDPNERIAEALEEIAIQLKRLNENRMVIISTEQADSLINEAVKRHGLPDPENLDG